mgnify:CR=1 FL=1
MNKNECYSLFCIKKSIKRGGPPLSLRLTLPLGFAQNPCVCRGSGLFPASAHPPAHPAHLWRSAAAARGGVRQLSRSAARTRKSPVFARLLPFSNARPNARTPSVKRERPEALETRRRRKKTPEQRRAAVVIDTERARRRRGVGSNFRRFSELTAPAIPRFPCLFRLIPPFPAPSLLLSHF